MWFLPASVRRSTTSTITRRPPLINLGTHARTYAVDCLVNQFLLEHQHSQPQVLSLGSGTDTRFWRFRSDWNTARRPWTCSRWVEVDFEEATSTKSRTISTKPEFKASLGDNIKLEQGGTALHSSLYSLLPLDLRSGAATLSATLLSHLDPTRPTLLLTECVLVYLSSTHVSSLLSWFTRTFTCVDSAITSYDPFNLNDAFGQVMQRNLAARGLSLPSALDTPSLESLEERLRATGFNGPAARRGALTVADIRRRAIPQEELQRVNKIEQIDEVEELNLVLGHYAVCWATRGPGGSEGKTDRAREEEKGGADADSWGLIKR